ncbi:MAG: glycosyltransferase family 4 protein [Lachnospiraceae bacterium]|nr:glycosyltransferase family 4 protein [Lachnospiraceae bacterium]
MKVLLLIADSNGRYPVPAVKGGAVATLVEHLVAGNNKRQLCDMEIVSYYSTEAEEMAKCKYPNIKFTWIKIPALIKLLDIIIYSLIKLLKKNGKTISYKSPFSLLYYIFRARRITNKTDAEKIIIENNVMLARTIRRSKFCGQWYYHFHNVPRIDAGCRNEFQKVTKFLCVSRFVAEQISGKESAIGQVKSEKADVLLNCIDTEMFRPIDRSNQKLAGLRNKYEIKKEDFVIIFAGRLSEEKGVDIVLDSMKSLPDNIKCLVVGSLLSGSNTRDTYQDRLHTLASDLGDRVIFTGYISQTELPFFYNLADVAVLPSIWDEPAGLTNLEAMACGLPVITTNSGGIPEYAKQAIILNRDEDLVNEIARTVIKMLNRREYCKEIAERGFYTTTNEFDSSNYIRRFVDLIM